MVPILDPFRASTSVRKPKRSGLKRVAALSVSGTYRTSLLAQLPKTLHENVIFLRSFLSSIKFSQSSKQNHKLPESKCFWISLHRKKSWEWPKNQENFRADSWVRMMSTFSNNVLFVKNLKFFQILSLLMTLCAII